jgi:hypothetical protein
MTPPNAGNRPKRINNTWKKETPPSPINRANPAIPCKTTEPPGAHPQPGRRFFGRQFDLIHPNTSP